jgi:hypothetical protein
MLQGSKMVVRSHLKVDASAEPSGIAPRQRLFGVICHCSMCRKHSGAPALAFVHFLAESFEWVKGNRRDTDPRPMQSGAFVQNAGVR